MLTLPDPRALLWPKLLAPVYQGSHNTCLRRIVTFALMTLTVIKICEMIVLQCFKIEKTEVHHLIFYWFLRVLRSSVWLKYSNIAHISIFLNFTLSFLKHSWESFCSWLFGISVGLARAVWFYGRCQLPAGRTVISNRAVIALLAVLIQMSDHHQCAYTLRSWPCPFFPVDITCCPFYCPCHSLLPLSPAFILLYVLRTTAYGFPPKTICFAYQHIYPN